MELVAGSLNVEIDDFLHAGYISAYPRTVASFGLSKYRKSDGKLIDVAKSLELKKDGSEPHSTALTKSSESPQPEPLLPHAAMSGNVIVLFVLFLIMAYHVSLIYRRIRKDEKPGRNSWLMAGVLFSLVLVLSFGVYHKVIEYGMNGLLPLDRSIALQEYRDPEAATRAIMHCLIENSLPGCALSVNNLDAIRYELAFPIPVHKQTPGMVYATKSYFRDGWGRDFAFEDMTKGRCRIASGGADGVFDTADDIVLVMTRKKSEWEDLINGFYFREVDEKDLCFIHRISHSLFRPEDADEARRLTGTEVFDVFDESEFQDSYHPYGDDDTPPVSPFIAKVMKYRKTDQYREQSDPLIFVCLGGAGHD